MIALIASALLGLYVFGPYVLFHRCSSLFIRLKKFQRSKTDEIVVGIVVAGLPFVLTLCMFWTGAIRDAVVLFPLADSHVQKVTDYQTVFASAYSEHYFEDHKSESWDALDRVCKRQINFLAWNYTFVILETAIFIALVRRYGEWKNFGPYAWLASRVLLPAVSEWHVLLTNFNFPPNEKRSVEVDSMSKDGILYRGTVVDHFLGTDGKLSGLLLKDAQRYQYDKLLEDRKSTFSPKKSTEQYWKTIAGAGNFYLPADNIASINIRYPAPKNEQERFIKELVEKLFKAKVELIIPTPEEQQVGDILIHGSNKVAEIKQPEETQANSDEAKGKGLGEC